MVELGTDWLRGVGVTVRVTGGGRGGGEQPSLAGSPAGARERLGGVCGDVDPHCTCFNLPMFLLPALPHNSRPRGTTGRRPSAFAGSAASGTAAAKVTTGEGAVLDPALQDAEYAAVCMVRNPDICMKSILVVAGGHPAAVLSTLFVVVGIRIVG